MIEDFSFGKIVVDGSPYNNDIKIIDGKVVSSWWRKSGHRVDIDDIRDVLEAKPDAMVIGQGDPGLMKATERLRSWFKKNNIELIEQKTAGAVRTYNRLVKEGKSVCAGFHVGC